MDNDLDTMSNAQIPLSHTRRQRPSRARGLRASTGCQTCRQRRVKCDEKKPRCGQCAKSDDRQCIYSAEGWAASSCEATASRKSSRPPLSSSTQSSDNAVIQTLPEPHLQLADATAVEEESQSYTHVGRSLTSENGRHITNSGPFEDDSRQSHHSPASLNTLQTRPHRQSPGNLDRLGQFPSHIFEVSPLVSNAAVNHYGNFNPASIPHYDDRSATNGSHFEITSLEPGFPLTPSDAPFQWYDLVAQDAINSIEKSNIAAADRTWNFDDWVPSRRGSQDRGRFDRDNPDQLDNPTATAPELDTFGNVGYLEFSADELDYLQYYVAVIGPMLDLLDRSRQFTEVVPHLAVRNLGLAKSMLAVAARYRSLQLGEDELGKKDRDFATQSFYETLNYLARAIQSPVYTKSPEILATAIMISTYEMFDGSNREWERHLKGAFWIQRFQNNDGESEGLRQAVWWAWVRQDIWAAFRDRRRTLTMWSPTRPLTTLSADELASRVVFIAAKAVEYASISQPTTQNWQARVDGGERLLQDLQAWYEILPTTYRPIPGPGFWVNPPAYAAALQYYHFAKLLVLLNKPSMGGIGDYRTRQVIIDHIVENVIGIVQAQPHCAELAFVNLQALYVAGLCVRESLQETVLELLARTQDATRFPSKSLVDDLRQVWQRESEHTSTT